MPAPKGLRPLSGSLLVLASLGVATMVGCGMGSSPTNVAASPALVGGILHGGPNPILGATIKLYATASNGYGGAGQLLATTTTDSTGSFGFNPASYTCPAGQQAYITAAAGNTGANAANPNSLLLAALGDCSTLSANTHIWISELTTVAAGYALSNFIKVSGTGATATVDISAPANNNVTSANAACTGTGSSMVCKAAGLTHAFQNALNLVDAVQQTTYPSGVTFSTVPGNSNGIVPALLINTLGNILQSCVNSTGGAAGSATPCGTLFTNTTPPTSSTASPVVPTNTLQAVVNLAKYPSMAPAQVAAIFGLQTAQIYYTPNLTTAPSDYSMAVIYTGPTSSSNYVYGFYSTTDIHDNIFTISETGNGVGSVVMNTMASNGSGGQTTATLTGALCTAGSPCVASSDALGRVWVANTNSSNLNVYKLDSVSNSVQLVISTPTGTAPNSTAVNSNNTVFVTSANNTANNLFNILVGSNTVTAVTAGGPPVLESVASPEYIAVDQAGSVWNTNYNSSNVTITYIQNTGTVDSPTFGNAPVTTTLATGGANVTPYTIMIDASGNAWVNSPTQLYKVAAGSTNLLSTYPISGVGGNSSTTPVTASSARFSTLDGDGNIFLPDNNSSKPAIFQFFPATSNFVFLSPCGGNSGACLTATNGPRALGASRNAITDSTGSIWVTNPVASTTSATAGSVTQIIGTAAPTWPQMSFQHPGVRPQ